MCCGRHQKTSSRAFYIGLPNKRTHQREDIATISSGNEFMIYCIVRIIRQINVENKSSKNLIILKYGLCFSARSSSNSGRRKKGSRIKRRGMRHDFKKQHRGYNHQMGIPDG